MSAATIACPECNETMRAEVEQTPTGLTITLNAEDAETHARRCYFCDRCAGGH